MQSKYEKYVEAEWLRERLRTYKLLKRLRDNETFRHKWAKQQVREMKEREPALDEAKQYDLILAYLQEFDFRFKERKGGPPTVHIEPRKFRGKYYGKILGIRAENMSTSLNKVARDAATEVVKGYGKTAILGNIFGTEYRNKLNAYIKKRIDEEFKA